MTAFVTHAFGLPSLRTPGLHNLRCRRSSPPRARVVPAARLRPPATSGRPDALISDFSHDLASPWNPDAESCNPSALDFESGGAPPIDTTGGSGRGDNDGESVEEVLRAAGRRMDDLPDVVRDLSSGQVSSYLTATSSGISGVLGQRWVGWARRCAADAEFPFKVLMELTVGVGLSASGMIAARGKNIIKELDFALCDIAVGGTLNFILVYLLTPVATAVPVSSMLARLPSNIFVAGQYSLGARAAGFAYKGALFACAGFAGSMIANTASRGLLAIRTKLAPDTKAPPMPHLLVTSAAWAGFMIFSANPRYQAVAGMERALFAFAPDALAKSGSGALRTVNNIAGGAIWVWWARFLGLQPKPGDSDAAVTDEEVLKK